MHAARQHAARKFDLILTLLKQPTDENIAHDAHHRKSESAIGSSGVCLVTVASNARVCQPVIWLHAGTTEFACFFGELLFCHSAVPTTADTYAV